MQIAKKVTSTHLLNKIKDKWYKTEHQLYNIPNRQLDKNSTVTTIGTPGQ
jgi:hypothetical protein